MSESLDGLAAKVYKAWKHSKKPAFRQHLDNEIMAGFLDGKLGLAQELRVKEHLLRCVNCSVIFAAIVKAEAGDEMEVPEELTNFARGLVSGKESNSFLEIILRVTGSAWEVLNTTGRVMVGTEDLALAALRSRKIIDFKDEVVILKDFKNVRIEVKVENKARKFFSVIVSVKKRTSGKTLKDLRIKLIKEGQELESFCSGSGVVTFEHVMLGKYLVEISDIVKKVASVILEIKK